MFTKRKITIHDEKKSSKPYEEAEAIGYLNTEPISRKMTMPTMGGKIIDAVENLKVFIRLPSIQTYSILAYGKPAHLLSKYATKGSKIYVRGVWIDDKIVAHEIELLETKEQTESRRNKNANNSKKQNN